MHALLLLHVLVLKSPFKGLYGPLSRSLSVFSSFSLLFKDNSCVTTGIGMWGQEFSSVYYLYENSFMNFKLKETEEIRKLLSQRPWKEVASLLPFQ